ncbi:Etoposide-induced protein 2.4 (EI24) [Novymonas esmeraldas]|uniref:Etoposide-induced protein 2.4 (EI24) n=1 Tax=Novymonas esmeraldas TaxID=1808958 RepID=A0AAW0F474_9TRYP
MSVGHIAGQVRQEAHNFCHGVVESFGVVLRPAWAGERRRAREEAAEAPELSTLTPPPPPPPTAASPSADSQSAAARPPSHAAPLQRTLSMSGSGGAAASHLTRTFWMPSWQLLERDPKLWMLLRKNLLANLALACVTLLYMGLSHCLTSRSSTTRGHAASRATRAHAGSGSGSGAADTAASSLTSAVFFWWVRLCLWMLKYIGQWPLYTVLQIIGLVWFSQLYRETWLVRKGWVLRGTGLREARTAGDARGRTAATTTTAAGEVAGASPSSSLSPPPPPPPATLAGHADTAPPWLSLSPLCPRSGGGDDVVLSSSLAQLAPAAHTCLVLLCSAPAYVRHTAMLVWRMVTHKGPTAPLQDWVLGDASAAAAAAAAAASSTLHAAHHHHQRAAHGAAAVHRSNTLSSAPDPFAAVVLHLEAVSEVLFKALATMSFALFAATVERLPLVGTPVCAFLNAQLYAFYVFDYRYAAQQQPDALHRRGSALSYQLHHFEQCSMYYAGYGMGSALLSLWLTRQLGAVVSVCAMSVLYSWQVVWSGFAVPLPSSRPVPLFSVWFYTVDVAQRHCAVLWRLATIAALLYLPFTCTCSLLGVGGG